MDEISEVQRKALEREGILYFDLRGLLKKTAEQFDLTGRQILLDLSLKKR